jgi:hypothetical protein
MVFAATHAFERPRHGFVVVFEKVNRLGGPQTSVAVKRWEAVGVGHAAS